MVYGQGFDTYAQNIDARIKDLENRINRHQMTRPTDVDLAFRLDILNHTMIEQLKLLRQSALAQPYYGQGVPPYSIKTVNLTTAHSDPGIELTVSGNSIIAFTDAGGFDGIQLTVDSPTNDVIDLNKINPVYLTSGFKTIWVRNIAVTDKILTLMILRGPPGNMQPNNTVGLYLQPEWASRQGTSVIIRSSNLGCAWSESTNETYTVPIGKAFFVTLVSYDCWPSVVGDSDKVHTLQFQINSDIPSVVQLSASATPGDTIVFSQPLKYVYGQTVTMTIWNYSSHDLDITFTVRGYLIPDNSPINTWTNMV